MKLNTLFLIYALTALGFCFGLILFPAFWITLYGARADAQASLLLSLVGALFGGLAVMAWVGRNAPPSRSRDAAVLGLAVSNGLAAMVAVFGAVSGVYNQFAWGPVITFVLFTVGFIVIGRPGATATTASS